MCTRSNLDLAFKLTSILDLINSIQKNNCIKFHLQSRPLVDLFGNSSDTRDTRNGGITGLVSLCKLETELKR